MELSSEKENSHILMNGYSLAIKERSLLSNYTETYVKKLISVKAKIGHCNTVVRSAVLYITECLYKHIKKRIENLLSIEQSP